ncbi:MAG TPA: ComF family protein [Patescibacteria group bacterium]
MIPHFCKVNNINVHNLILQSGALLLKSKKVMLDTLFPIFCLRCHKEGSWICDSCLEKIPINTEQLCPLCEKTETPNGRTCFACRKKTSLDGLIVAASYRDKLISHTIHLFKYSFVADLHKPLGGILVKALLKTDAELPNFIIPVPLHPRRLRWRGFNQAELLSQHLAKNILPANELAIKTDTLERLRYTGVQKSIKNIRERKSNIAGAFKVKNKQDVFGKTILLIDDVATTGATLFECAKTLKQAGARQVFALVVARQELNTRRGKQR